MLDFLRAGRLPTDARDLLALISARYPVDREKCLRVFVAAVHDDPRYLRNIIEYAFQEVDAHVTINPGRRVGGGGHCKRGTTVLSAQAVHESWFWGSRPLGS
jgi:hypothetical protein